MSERAKDRVYPDDWSECRLGDVCPTASGGTPSRTVARFWNGDVPWVKTAEINYRTINDTDEKITSAGLSSSSARLLPKGTVVMALFGQGKTRGRVARLGIDASVNQACLGLLQGEKLDNSFLFHVLTERYEDLRQLSHDGTQQNLNASLVKSLQLPIPPWPQQRKIATILTTVDRLIEKTQAVIAKYQAIKQGMMHDLFTRGVDEHGHLRPTYDKAPDLYKESELGWIPKEWEEDSLGNVCTWMSGGTPSKSNVTFWSGSIPWVSPKDMKVFELCDSEDHITEEAARIGSRTVPAGTVLIVIRGMILAHSFPVAITKREVAFNQDIKALLFDDTTTARFVAHWFVAHKAKMIAIATESTHGTKRFDLSDVYEIPIGMPQVEETARIVAILDSLDAKQTTENWRLEKLRLQKTGLMQDLLTGKVRVKVDGAEEAE